MITYYSSNSKACIVNALHVILIREDLLTTLAAGHAVLLLLAELGGRKLGLLLGSRDLVSTVKYVSSCSIVVVKYHE